MLRQSCKRLLGVAVGMAEAQYKLLAWKSAVPPCRFLSQVSTRDLPLRDLPAGFEDDDPDVGTGYASSRHTIKMQIRVDPNTRKIVDVFYFPSGCPCVIACSSTLASSELLKGKKLDEAVQVNEPEIVEQHKRLPCVNMKCVFYRRHTSWSMLVQIAIKAAVRDYERKHGGEHSAVSSASYFTC